MASLTPAQGSLANALNFEAPCNKTGALKSVHQFGHNWIEKRERFGSSFVEGVIGTIHSFVSAIFHSMWSLTVGVFGSKKELRDLAVKSWEDLGNNITVIFKAFIGIACPTAAKWMDERAFSVVPKIESSSSKANESGTVTPRAAGADDSSSHSSGTEAPAGDTGDASSGSSGTGDAGDSSSESDGEGSESGGDGS